jgi:hypothetical protein
MSHKHVSKHVTKSQVEHHSLRSEVPTSMVILHESIRYSRYNAVDNLLHSREA